jgi:inner membrane protein
LLWPFSDTRISWSIIAIVDPLFSLSLLLAFIFAFKLRKTMPARIGLGLAGTYLLLGVWQHQSALQAAIELAEQRGHSVQRILVKPTLANLVLWRSVYQSNDRFYVDAIRVGLQQVRIYPGESIPKFNQQQDLPQLARDSILSSDIHRFSNLADGYVVNAPNRENVLSDIRYSMLPTAIAPMWGIDLNLLLPSEHANFTVYRDRPDNANDLFLTMLRGHDLLN